MNTARIRAIGIALTASILTVSVAVLLWWKLDLGLHRYFDADEFAYLHWAHSVSAGRIPIRDFLLYAPPGFLYVLSPIFFLWSGTMPLLIARVLAWLIYTAIAVVLGGIFALVRGGKRSAYSAWLLPVCMLFLLPIPSDKFLEIRPDNLATLLSLFGIYMEILALQRVRLPLFLWSGLFFALSISILPKTLPFIIVGIGVLILRYVFDRDDKAANKKAIEQWMLGFCIPCLAFLLWTVYAGRTGAGMLQIVYSLTVLPFEVGRIAERFGMQVDLFFYPNGIYYGQAGWGSVLSMNHLLWLFGICVAAIRLVTPFIPGGKKGVWAEVLLAGSFFASVLMFMYGYPLRHAQYLIPVAVWIAWYVSDGVLTAARLLWHKKDGLLVVPFAALAISILIAISYQSYVSKRSMTNDGDIQLLDRVIKTVPRNAYVFDLVGSTIYYRDPYYVSAVPFGEWEPYLSRPLPPLIPALQKTGTDYIYAGKLGRISSLGAADRAYIQGAYRPMGGELGDMLVKQK